MCFIKDNPNTDVYGANVYNRYLQTRTVSQVNEIVSLIASDTLAGNADKSSYANHRTHLNSLQIVRDSVEQYHTAESLEPILVCTGVYNRDTYDENSITNHGHRDMIVDSELKKSKYICEHVLDAVKLIFEIENRHK